METKEKARVSYFNINHYKIIVAPIGALLAMG